jgi:Flp pilus assembly protein TadB
MNLWLPVSVLDGVAIGGLCGFLAWPRGRSARLLVPPATPSRDGSQPAFASLQVPLPFVAISAGFLAALAAPWGPLSPAAVVALGSLVVLASGPVWQIWQRRRQVARLGYLFPDWLAALALAVEIGMPLNAALRTAAAATDREMAAAARILAEEADASRPIQEALEHFSRRVDLPEARFVAELLSRHQILGTSLEAVLLREEGLLSRLRWVRLRREEQMLPYAFAVSGGVLLTNAFLVLAVPRVAAMLSSLIHVLPA